MGAFAYTVASLLFPVLEAMVDQTITSHEFIDSRLGTTTEDEKAQIYVHEVNSTQLKPFNFLL